MNIRINQFPLMSLIPKLSYLATPGFLLLALAMVMLRIPPFLLDTLFTFNIAFSLLMLLLSINMERPLDFSSFPSLLLLATLLRLALNVASTRIVLLQGHTGSGAAGNVIEAFGAVAIGGNYLVGFVIFIILIIVNFVVITKGCSRISEVTARFTLDAMPGKQMAIDADLNAGIIDQHQAKKRREEITYEADFYGAMDGSSKFVRGDAIASLMILAINLIGGILIGMMQHEMAAADAVKTYALLTIGDGLIAQIPSLLLSTTAAIMVTRVSNEGNMPSQIHREILSSPKSLIVTASIIIMIGLAPGMPHLAFIGLGTVIIAFIISRHRHPAQAEAEAEAEKQAEQEAEDKGLSWQDLPPVDPVSLEIGYRLIPLVDKNATIDLVSSIKGVRKDLSQKLGFLLPNVHIKDNLSLDPDVYAIKIHGVSFAEQLIPNQSLLALKTDNSVGILKGIATKDPAYGLDAFWINRELQEDAIRRGYTIVDGAMVISTHIGRILEESAHELFGHEEAQSWLDQLKGISPKLAEDLIQDKVSLSLLVRICQQLLMEKIPLTDVRTIAAALADSAIKGKDNDPTLLCQQVRVSLKRMIAHKLVGMSSTIEVYTLSQEFERLLLQSWQQAKQQSGFSADTMPLEPNMTAQLQDKLPHIVEKMQYKKMTPILLVAPQLRPMLGRIARICAHELNVLAFTEIPDDRQIKVMGQLG